MTHGPLPPPAVRVDPRDLKGAVTVADRNGYYDSQNVVRVRDADGTEVLSVVYHHSENREGGPGLRLWSVRSTDGGTTWSRPLAVEDHARQSHDGYQLVQRRADGHDRILLFYGWNIGSHPPGGPPLTRTDMQLDEGYWLRISDDAGRSWGDRRWCLPVRRTRIDRENPWGGATMGMFLCDKPSVIDGAVVMAFQKTRDGAGETPGSEAFLLRSPDLLTVDDPGDATWLTLPDGDEGLQCATGELRLGEEPHVFAVSDALPGRLGMVWRTEVGRIAAAWSDDGGHRWSAPGFLTYDGHREVRHPRGSLTPFRLRGEGTDGDRPEILLVFYGNGRTEREGYVGRRVAWYTLGRGGPDGQVRWAEPEIGLYWDGTGFEDRPGWTPDWAIVDGPGYFDLEQLADGSVVMVESNKLAVRFHRIEPRLLAALRRQHELDHLPVDGLVVDSGPTDGVRAAPVLPDLRAGGGFTVTVHLEGHRPTDPVLGGSWSDVTAALGEEPTDVRIRKGYEVRVTDDGQLELLVDDGFGTSFRHRTTVAGHLLWDGGRHTVAFVVDGGPKVVSVVVDERLDDGGDEAPQGWAFVPATLGEIGGAELTVRPAARRWLVHHRALLTSECIAMARALRI